MRNPLSLRRPLFWANCGAQSLQWQSEPDSSLTPIKSWCQPGLGAQLPGRGNLGKGGKWRCQLPTFALCSPQVAHPSLVTNSGCMSSAIICPTCKASSSTKHTTGIPGTRWCSALIRRRQSEGTSRDFHQTPHWVPCLVPVPLQSEPAAGRWLQDRCLLTQSHRRSVLELQITLGGCYRNGNVPTIRESIKPTGPWIVVLAFNCCIFRSIWMMPSRLLLATQPKKKG